MNIDVYETQAGKHERTIAQFGQENPVIMFAAR
jgi:hypothetical protein